MPIQYQILGKPFLDNALWVRIETGQAIHRLLFDCGEAVLYNLGNAEIQNIEHLFISHCHMDHIAGFDSFLRLNYNRPTLPVYIWGPQDTARVMSNRLRGFTWNLVDGQPGLWKIHEITTEKINCVSYYTADSFTQPHDIQTKDMRDPICAGPDFYVKAIFLEHGISCLGYVVGEPTRWNVSKEILTQLGLTPGPWLNIVKNFQNPGTDKITVGQKTYSLEELRSQILSSSIGQNIAYLTDFILNESTKQRLIAAIPPHTTIICESQYLHKDLDLAQKNFHLTSRQAAEIAAAVSANKLILIHISQRYTNAELPLFLAQAREIFPATYFPEESATLL